MNRYQTFNGDGLEQGAYTIDEARAKWLDVEFDDESNTISVGDVQPATVHEIAAELNRLYPSQVDEKVNGAGNQLAGHAGYDDVSEGTCRIGWYCDGGNVGNPVFDVPNDRISDLLAHLRTFDDGALDASGAPILQKVVANFGCIWLA